MSREHSARGEEDLWSRILEVLGPDGWELHQGDGSSFSGWNTFERRIDSNLTLILHTDMERSLVLLRDSQFVDAYESDGVSDLAYEVAARYARSVREDLQFVFETLKGES